MGGESRLYLCPVLQQGEQCEEEGQVAVEYFAGVLPQLPSLQTVHVCFNVYKTPCGHRTYRAFIGSMQQWTALTELWLDFAHAHEKIPDTLESLPSALATL